MSRAGRRAALATCVGMAAGAAFLYSPAALAQAEPRLEIVVFGHMKAAVRGRIYLVFPNNNEEYLAMTNDHGVAAPPFARCRPDYRVVVKPEDVSYYQSTDLQCPETSLRLEVQLYLRGGEVTSSRTAPASSGNVSSVSAPVAGAGRLPSATESRGTSKPMQM